MTLNRRQFGALMAAPLALGLPGRAAAGAARPLAFGLAPVNDWATQQPFLDVFKTARRWIGHLPKQWGGVDFATLEARGLLDAQGWPKTIPGDLGSIGTVILTDMPEAADLAGRYLLRFDGTGIVEVSGRATNKRYGEGEVAFDYAPGPGPVEIRIQRSDPRGAGDHVRNIRVTREADRAALESGALFRPGFLDMLRGAKCLRFMDWMNTNDSGQGDWSARPRVSDFSYTRYGVPVEVMLALANTLESDAWFNMPHLADDAYLTGFARMVKDGLAPGLKAHVEYSNEMWNWQFLQTEWADAKAFERWGEKDRGAQFHGMRAAEAAQAWARVFQGGDRARLVNVIATQTGWLGLERHILTAPLYTAEAPGNRPPAEAFDAYAVAGYFGHFLGTKPGARMVHEWLREGRAGGEAEAFAFATQRAAAELRDGAISGDPEGSVADLIGRILPYHAEVAKRHGLDLIMYEGGSHVVGTGPRLDDDELTAFFIHLNYSPQMGALYNKLLDGWSGLTGGVFNHYADMQAPGKWGSWGALRWPGDDNPRWQALARLK
ncbi:hypothetical protein D6850_05195 [Roseovarius spongiae]|uniref:Cellulose-binding protein n=1 Tax=Roseovarius spongiae TaxID=2320272 RepID=A0A3A8AYA5_9RHOB|nr:hypothetical protein [Roseovarius spongiae]RKF16927.1 hypothetical protein D6850_05195 [Roseovarius spongiae]